MPEPIHDYAIMIPAGDWQKWQALAVKYDYSRKVRAAIRAIKPKPRKQKTTLFAEADAGKMADDDEGE